MPGVFVTATGTEIGKTFVTCGLVAAGRRAGHVMDALKPVLTGDDPAERAQGDAGLLLAALGRPLTEAEVARIAPWRFAAPLSPNMAAARESRRIDFEALCDVCRARVAADALVVVEGIGGVMVPLDSSRTVRDLIAALAIPVVLVSGTALGALSYALTAVEALRAIARPPALLVLNETPGTTVPLEDSRATLADFCPGTAIEILRRAAAAADFDRLFATHLASLIPPAPPVALA